MSTTMLENYNLTGSENDSWSGQNRWHKEPARLFTPQSQRVSAIKISRLPIFPISAKDAAAIAAASEQGLARPTVSLDDDDLIVE